MFFENKFQSPEKSGNFFYKNRSRFLGLYISIVVILAIIVFYFTMQYINIEERHASEINCEYVHNICDTTLENIEYRLYQLSTDNDIVLFFADFSPERYFLSKNNILKSLKIITTGEKYITTAYLYNAFTDTVLFNDTAFSLNDENDTFTDTGWYEEFKKMKNREVRCYKRKKNLGNSHYITIIRKRDERNYKGGVILNIDIEHFMQLAQGDYKTALTDGDGTLLYASDKTVETLFEKNNFNPTENYIKKQNGKYYAIKSMKSKFSDFNYYTLSELNGYTSKLVIIFFAIFFVGCIFIFFGFTIASYLAFQSYRPIINIAALLENPEDEASRKYLENDVNTKFIAERIMYVINSNEKLKTQLNTKNALFDSAQITALQTQINPHFIYNTLSLFYLTAQDALGKKHSLSTGLIALSKIMRYCLSSDNSIVNLKEEVESANEYLKIMNSRYNDRFEVRWDIDDECYDKKIVKMSLQPILENIFKYAFGRHKKDGVITVKIKKENQNIIISIKDNGVGIAPERLAQIREKLKSASYTSSRHIGLANVDKRIKIIYGEDYGISIFSECDRGTDVIITIPDRSHY